MDRNQIKKWFKEPKKMGNKYSLHAIYFCSGCGIMEIPPSITARWDAERFGIKTVDTPRQANLFLITGYVSLKTLKPIIRTYEQMPEPRYTVAFGSCPIDGGMYWDSYNTINHLDKFIPIDGYIAGCMPRPEAVFTGVTHLWKMIDSGEADGYKRYREKYDQYRSNQEEIYGELDWPRQFPQGEEGEEGHGER